MGRLPHKPHALLGKNVKLMDGTKTDVKVTVDLECKEYEGVTMGFPKLQATDTHIGSTGNAIFNWRVVYPRIVMPTKSCTLEPGPHSWWANSVGSLRL